MFQTGILQLVAEPLGVLHGSAPDLQDLSQAVLSRQTLVRDSNITIQTIQHCFVALHKKCN